jgi:hypothetical protein
MDDTHGVLVNTVLVAALVPVLTAIGQLLKNVPYFAAIPQWLPLINAVLGIGIALAYTFARTQPTGLPPTAMEVLLAVIAGVLAGGWSGRVHDAATMAFGPSKESIRAERLDMAERGRLK